MTPVVQAMSVLYVAHHALYSFLLMTLCIMDNLAVSKMAAVFKPIIRWAQSKERIFLTLELSDVQVW